MFVVKTTSATVGAVAASLNCPRKRVPSSRRRNPGEKLGSATDLRRLRRWRGSLRVRSGGYRKHVWSRLRRRGSGRRRRRREGLIQNRARRGTPGGRHRENEGQPEKNPSTPPTH